MLPQKAFKKSNLHSMIWIYSEQETVCTQKCTLFPYLGIMGVAEVKRESSWGQFGEKVEARAKK